MKVPPTKDKIARIVRTSHLAIVSMARMFQDFYFFVLAEEMQHHFHSIFSSSTTPLIG